MNKWKIAFYLCFTILVIVTVFSLYTIIDRGTTINYMGQGYSRTQDDLNNLTKIINDTDLSKTQIQGILKQHYFFQYTDFSKDTIAFNRISLIFKNDKLIKVRDEWYE